VPSVRAGLAFSGEIDPPLSLKRNSRVGGVTACVTRLEAGNPVKLQPILTAADAEWAEALVLPWEAAALGCQMAVWELESALL